MRRIDKQELVERTKSVEELYIKLQQMETVYTFVKALVLIAFDKKGE